MERIPDAAVIGAGGAPAVPATTVECRDVAVATSVTPRNPRTADIRTPATIRSRKSAWSRQARNLNLRMLFPILSRHHASDGRTLRIAESYLSAILRFELAPYSHRPRQWHCELAVRDAAHASVALLMSPLPILGQMRSAIFGSRLALSQTNEVDLCNTQSTNTGGDHGCFFDQERARRGV